MHKSAENSPYLQWVLQYLSLLSNSNNKKQRRTRRECNAVFTFFTTYFAAEWLHEGFELISYTPNGFENPLVRNALKLLTKSFNVNVNSS